MKCIKCATAIDDNSVYCNFCGAKQIVSTKKVRQKSRGNGQGSVYQMKNRKWRIEITVMYKTINGSLLRKRITRQPFDTKKEAQEAIVKLQLQPAKDMLCTLNDLWYSWSETAMLKLSKSKQTHFKTAFNKIESISFVNIKHLTIDDLQKVIDNNAPTHYPAKDIKTLLSHLYNRGVAQQIVPVNLAEYLVIPSLDEKERTPFNETELKSLWLDFSKGYVETGYVLLMIYSGMMPGELFEAKKEMIDWDKQSIMGCGLKTKKRKQTPIVVADIVIPVLQALCEYSKTDKIISIQRDVFYKTFKEILIRCNCRPLTPYCCRHTTATALALGNIAPTIIKEVMRHTKFSTTQTYIHVDTAPMLQAVNTLNK